MLKAADTYTMGQHNRTVRRTKDPSDGAPAQHEARNGSPPITERVELLDCTVGDYSYLEHDCGGLY